MNFPTNLTKLTAASVAALFVGLSAANAAMILRQDANGNKVVVNTETEAEARIYGPGPVDSRPDDCQSGGFFTMMDGDREVYVACDDETMQYTASMDTMASGESMMEGDRPLEPYAPGTEGVNN
ncbi:hypothetical protein [Afifella pfennigii]|uniref:hypothetical protein n=1 Tax=Afifella pfennigii TaxID=209897 RepID=UPI00047AE84F|nr:hypothetical protein [Afifella pfennigii]